MAAQQHKIMRQVLEARGCPPGAAERVRSELRGAYYQRLLPLIEKVCSELSAPGRIHRIERLEIDLGDTPLDALEPAIAGRFEAAFSRELAAAIGDAPELDADLELFRYFVRTGTVPWWADRSDGALLEASLERLIERAPQALRRTMQALPDATPMRRRIALAYPDRLLDELAGVMAPPLSAACPAPGTAWLKLLEAATSARGHPARSVRNLWWEELLRAAAAGGAAIFEAPRFYRAVLTRVARRLGIEYRALLAELSRTLDDRALGVQPWVRATAERLCRELEGKGESPGSASPREPVGEELARMIGRLPAGLRGQASALLEAAQARDAAGARATLDRATVDALAALVRAALEQGRVAPPLGAQLLAALRDPDRAAPGEEASVDSGFSDADEIYVENAGVVILWPFLANFFARLGLLEEKAFKDAADAQRAAGLLHYLATGDAPAPEPLLPLNKLLCGMALEEVFDFGPPMTDAELEACDDLLGAAIHQAPILRDMSIAGFRASFLLRKGQLGARDGNWLLRVERETHDIVLERFPWSFHHVKLPWMRAIMQVEW
jgi:Contractile injection system tape measure protein